MKVALYIGDHAKDGFLAQLGWWITRFAQRGEFQSVTHVEAILDDLKDGLIDNVLIASASARDGRMVRTKRARLTPGNWRIIDVPAWDVSLSKQWFAEHDGAKYDWLGAAATFFQFAPKPGRYFCNQAVGAPFLIDAGLFSPAEFSVICLSMPGSKDVTSSFFFIDNPTF